MKTETLRPADEEGASLSASADFVSSEYNDSPSPLLVTLAALPIGARLVLRCRTDWRTATVSFIADERITLTVHAPSGKTYRVRRPHDEPLRFDGAIPLLESAPRRKRTSDDEENAHAFWRAGLARYDVRW